MEIDMLTQTWTDLNGLVHVVEPLQYLHLISDEVKANQVAQEIVKELSKAPSELLEIKDKYKTIAASQNEVVPYGGSGRHGSANIPKFRFNPMRRGKK